MNEQEPVNPYQSPSNIHPSSGHRNGGHIHGFVSGHTLAVWAIIMLAVVMVGRVAIMGFNCATIRMLPRIVAGETTQDERVLFDLYGMLTSVVSVAIFVLSAVTFIMWFYRAHRNLRALGYCYLDYAPGWTIGGWFVPIGNLFIPYLVMVEIWRGSDPARLDRASLQRAPSLALVRGWWLFWLLMTVVSPFSGLLGRNTVDSIIVSMQFRMAIHLITLIPAALLAILLIRRIDANQEECYRLALERHTTAPSDDPTFLSHLGEGNPAMESADGNAFAPPPVPESSEQDRDERIPTLWLDKDE